MRTITSIDDGVQTGNHTAVAPTRGDEAALIGAARQGQPEAFAVPLRDWTLNPAAPFEQREREGLLHEAIDTLRPSIRHAIQIHKPQERSVEKTSKILGLSVTATKSRIYHATESLRGSVKLRSIRRPAGPQPQPLPAA